MFQFESVDPLTDRPRFFLKIVANSILRNCNSRFVCWILDISSTLQLNLSTFRTFVLFVAKVEFRAFSQMIEYIGPGSI